MPKTNNNHKPRELQNQSIDFETIILNNRIAFSHFRINSVAANRSDSVFGTSQAKYIDEFATRFLFCNYPYVDIYRYLRSDLKKEWKKNNEGEKNELLYFKKTQIDIEELEQTSVEYRTNKIDKTCVILRDKQRPNVVKVMLPIMSLNNG
jgi:hypothetical protein